MKKDIRVLVVDDEVIVRQMLARSIDAADGISVAGIAGDSAAAKAAAEKERPDVILLDLDFPNDDGLQVVADFRASLPQTPIIVLSPRSVDGARRAFAALDAGVADVLTKPEKPGSMLFATGHVAKRLEPMIRAIAPQDLRIRDTGSPPISVDRPMTRRSRRDRVDIVAIGGCSGGPQALARLLPGVPSDFLIPIIIVQHLPKHYTKALAKWLDLKSRIRVLEGRPGDKLVGGTALIAPGGFHSTVFREGPSVVLSTHRGPREHGCRPSIDVLFRSVADTFGSTALGIVLSGAGKDGIDGCMRLRKVGAEVLVQDEAGSLVPDLPGTIAGKGLADQVMRIEDMADGIYRRARAVPSRPPSFGNTMLP